MYQAAANQTDNTDHVPTKVRWRILFLLLGLAAVTYVDRTSLSVAMPIISTEFELTPEMQGLILAAFFWTYSMMQIPGGMLADKLGPRAILAGGAIFWGIFQCLGALSSGWLLLFATRLGLGVSEGPFYPAGNKLNSIWMPPGERGRGAALLGCGAPLGAALGALIIASLITYLGSWRSAFTAAGFGTIGFGLLAWQMIRDRPEQHPAANQAERDYIERGMTRSADDGAEETGTLGEIFRNRSVWLMFVGWVANNTIWTGLLTWMPNYLASTHALKIASVGGFSFIIFLSGSVGELVGGAIIDWLLHRNLPPNVVYRWVFCLGAACATTAMFVVASAPSLTICVVALSIGLFFTRWGSLYWVIPPILAGRSRTGVLTGCMNFTATAWGGVLPIIIGFLVQRTGSYFAVLCLFGGFGLLMLLASLSIDYRTPPRLSRNTTLASATIGVAP